MKRAKVWLITVVCINLLMTMLSIPRIESVSAACAAIGLSLPSLKTGYTHPLTPAAVGEEFIVAVTATNICPDQEGQQFIGIIEVRDSDGITQYFDWQSGTLERSTGRVELGVSWTPDFADSYEIRAFIIRSFENPEILSSVKVSMFEIAEADTAMDHSESQVIQPVQGRFSISHSGNATLTRQGSSPASENYEIDVDIFGNFDLNDTESGFALDVNNVILSLKDRDDVFVVYGFDYMLSSSADYRLLTYSAELGGYAKGNLTGAIQLDSPVYSGLARDQISRINAEANTLQAEVDGRVYEGAAPSTDALLVFVPESQIYSTVIDRVVDPDYSFLKWTVNDEEHTSVDPSVGLRIDIKGNASGASDASNSPTSVIFSAVNTGTTPASLEVDRWIIGYGYGRDDYSSRKEVIPEGPVIVLPSQSFAIAELDLSELYHSSIAPPGTYSVSINGMRWYEKDFGTHKELSNWDEYSVKGAVKLEYEIDSEDIGLLYARNMVLRINGTSPETPFVAEADFLKSVELFIVHNDNSTSKISSLVHLDSVAVWSLEDNSLKASVGGIADYFGEYECRYLQKDDMTRMGAVAISASYWPIGKNGIAQQADSMEAPPGIYILEASASTLPCTLDNGEKVGSGGHSLIAAFEVR